MCMCERYVLLCAWVKGCKVYMYNSRLLWSVYYINLMGIILWDVHPIIGAHSAK